MCCAYCIISQFAYTERLNYTDSVRYSEDVRLAEALNDRIYSLDVPRDALDGCPLIVVGRHVSVLNAVCEKDDEVDLSHSFFDWDTDVSPFYFFSSRRIVGFMDTLGYKYSFATMEQVEAESEFAASMPIWPDEGSIAYNDGILIIRLSER